MYVSSTYGKQHTVLCLNELKILFSKGFRANSAKKLETGKHINAP